MLTQILHVKEMNEQIRATEAILADLSKGILNCDQINDILKHPFEFPTKLIEEISIATALKYWHRQLSYSEGDRIMNNLFIYWTASDFADKNHCVFAWECYLAFDSGEFYRENDDKTIDPSEKYTRPLIETLLKNNKRIE